MDWNIERVVPKEMSIGKSELQRISLENHLERYHVAAKWIVQHFTNHRPRILDLGCGTGFGSEILSYTGDVLGVDLDEDAVEYARNHYQNHKSSFTAGNADDLSFLNTLGRFDAVVSLETIEHLDNHHSYLNWVNQSLRPGGVLIASFPSTLTMDWAAPHHKRDISRRQAAQLFKRCGFKIIKKFRQDDKLDIRHVIFEIKKNRSMPTPPMRHWIARYLRNPYLLAMRLYQITLGRGIYLAHQQYLLSHQD